MTFTPVYNTFQSYLSLVTHSCLLLSYQYLCFLLSPALMSFGGLMNFITVVHRSVGEGLYTEHEPLTRGCITEENISLFLSSCNSSLRKGWGLEDHLLLLPLSPAVSVTVLVAHSDELSTGADSECRAAMLRSQHSAPSPSVGRLVRFCLQCWELNAEPGPCSYALPLNYLSTQSLILRNITAYMHSSRE